MVDSTNINDEPNVDLVLYYCDGEFAVSEAAVRTRFPNAIPVPCSAIGTNSGIVGDCEPGCMTEDQLVDWVLERRAAGVDPTGYVNEMHGWVPAKAAFARRGVAEPHWGVADYDAIDVIPPGAVFKQDKNSAQTGGHFDRSVVVDFWPGVDSVFGPGGGSLGVDDMTPEEHAWIRVAARGQLPPRPASLGDEFEATGGHTDGAFLDIYAHSSTAAFIAAYGQDGYAYISALYHGAPRAAATMSADLSPVTALQGVTNNKVDAVMAKVSGLTLKAQ